MSAQGFRLAGPVLLALAAGAMATGCSPATEPRTRTNQAANASPIGTTSTDEIDEEVVVTLAPGTNAVELAADYGATVAEESDWDCYALLPGPGDTPESLTGRLAGDSRVLTAEPNTALEPAESRQQSFSFDDGFGSPTSYANQGFARMTNLVRAHGISRGAGVRVAILDTGAEIAHPALAGRVAGGWDFIDGDADPSETGDLLDNDGDGRVDEALGHGTHVAGIVALTAPGARLLIVRVLDADGRGDLLTVAAGVRWAQAQGARVINLSLGALSSSDAVQYALEQAEDSGVVSFAAVGNWGSEQPVEYPARSSHAFAVAALDAQDRAASFTSFGGHVAISAPGVAVRSAFPNGGYALWSGTSMSTPIVSGVAALLIALHPTWDSQAVLDRIAVTARPLDDLNPGYHNKLGAGALDAGAALWPDRDPSPTGGTDEPAITLP